MPKARIPSPSRSQGTTTPRRNRPRRSRSVCSPALSNASGRLTSVIDQFKENNMESFTISPMKSRWSVLTDNTDIDEPRRKSWWKNLNENSQDFMEVLEDNRTDSNNSIGDISDIEVESQENKNLSSLDLPESSDNESIHSIVLTQRRLFTQKEKRAQKKFDQLIDERDKLTKLHKSNTTFHDKTITARTKDLFQGTKKSKTVFPALLNISANKTTLDKTVENVVAEPKIPVKNIFGNRPAKKRKNIFADFIVSDSEHEVSDIQVQAKQSLLKRKKNDKTEDQVDEGKIMEVSLNLQEMVRQKYNASRDVGDEVNENQNSDQRCVDQDIESQKSNFESKDGKGNANKQINDLTNKNTVIGNTMDHVDNTALGFDNDDKISEKSDTESNGSLKLTYDSEGHQEIDENIDPNKATDAVSEQDEQEKMTIDTCDKIKSTEKICSNSSIEPNKSLELANNSKVPKKVDEMVYKAIEAKEMLEQDDKEKMAVDNYDIEKNTVVNKQNSILIVADKTVENEKDKDENKLDAEHEESETIETDKHEQTIVNNDQVKENVANTEHVESVVDKDQNEDNEVDNNRLEENGIDENEVNEVEDDKSQENEVGNDVIEGDAKLEESQLDDDEIKEVDNDEMEVDDEKAENQVDSEKNEEEVEENQIEVDAELEVDDEEEKTEVDSDRNEELDDNEIEIDAELEVDDEKEENEVDSDKNEEEVDNNEIEVKDAELDKSQLDNNEKKESEVDSDEEEDDDKLEENQSDNDEDEENAVDSEENEEREVESDKNEEDALDNDESIISEVENEDNEIENDENEEGVEHEESVVDYDEDEVDNDENDIDDELEQSEVENDQMEENEVDSDDNEDTGVGDDDNEVEDENNEDDDENQEHPSRVISSDEVIEESPNVTHDTTGRNRKKVKSPEVALHDKTKQQTSFIAKGRNTSIRETKSMYKDLNIRPRMASPRDSLGLSEGDSSAEGSGWDSHRTTRKTLRQTFGKDFTPRKSLRALVMEKSAKRTTNMPESESVLLPQANSTEYPQDSHSEVDVSMESEHVPMESVHEVSRRTRQTTLETYLQKIKQQNLEKKLKMEQAIRESLKAPPTRDTLSLFKVPSKPPPRRPKPTSNKPKKQLKSALFGELPSEVIEDMKYKPPKRFQPSNASWITKRLYKFLETKLEPKYDYKTRVRAEKLVETIYHFAKDLRRHNVAPVDAVDVLKHELARLEIVKTHFEFYEFFHEFMPREVRVKVVPDIVNKIPLPRHGVFADILRRNAD